MKKIRYVEAMVTNDATEREHCSADDWSPSKLSGLRAAMETLTELTSETPMSQWLDTIAIANEAWADLAVEIENHECECDRACESDTPDDPIPLVAVGGTPSIGREIDLLWLPGEMLATLKLSDLRDLIGERERNDHLCYYLTEEASAPCATKPS